MADRSSDIRYILEREKALGLRPSQCVPVTARWCHDPDCPEWRGGPPFWNHTHPH